MKLQSYRGNIELPPTSNVLFPRSVIYHITYNLDGIYDDEKKDGTRLLDGQVATSNVLVFQIVVYKCMAMMQRGVSFPAMT